MSLRPGAEHTIELWKKLPGSASQLKSSLDLYDEVFSRVCDRKKAQHLVAVEKKFNKMFENSDVKSIGTKDLRQMIELKHTKCKARPLRKDFDQGNPEAKVQSVTEKAFQEVRSGDWEAAIKTLSELYCIGPATATSILSFVDPLVCYAADEVLNVAATRVYDLKTTVSMNKNLIEITKTLNETKSGSDSFIWAPNHIGKGLYSWAVMNADKGYSGGPVSPMTDLITKVNAGCNDEENKESSKGVKRVLVEMDNKNNSTKKRVKK